MKSALKSLLYASNAGVDRIVPASVKKAILREHSTYSLAKRLQNSKVFNGEVLESMEAVPPGEDSIAKNLLSSFKHASAKQKSVPQAYLPGEGWNDLLKAQWQSFRKAIDQEDLQTFAQLLRNFFRNEGLSGFWGNENVFETFKALSFRRKVLRANTMLDHYDSWREMFPNGAISDLEAPKIGNPWGYSIEGKLLYEPAFEYSYQAAYSHQLLKRIPAPTILELGGGFGGTAYHLLKRVPNAKYIGLDLPESILLQGYYLSSAFPKARILLYHPEIKTIDRALLEQYDIVLLPNFLLPNLEASLADLILNCRSLSEMSIETIKEYFSQIDRIGRLWFYHENLFKPRRDGVYGVPSTSFPELHNFQLVASSETRWSRYKRDSLYPCRENLFIHNSCLQA